jgi:hypothetical protein
MSPNHFAELLRRNPRRLSQEERAVEEAEKVAEQTGRYITRGDGTRVYSKTFVKEYSEMVLRQDGFA